MNRKQAVLAAVSILIGFILGFFTAQIGSPHSAALPPPAQTAGGIPENHPTPETMEHLTHLQEEAQQDPQNRAVRIELGNAYYDMGRFDSAVSWYEQALALKGDDPDVNTDLGTAKLYLGDVEEAIRIYERSLAIEPSHPQTLQNLGIAYYAAGQFSDAVTYWERLLEEHPQYQNADAIREQIVSAREKAASPQEQ